MLEATITAYNDAVFDTDRDRAMAVIRDALDRGLTAEEIVFQVVIPALEGMVAAIGEKLEANLAQHYMASQIAAEVTEAMVERFVDPPTVEGHVVIGTAHGDLHTLGKRIVTGCVKSMMIGVTDLGVNVAPQRFVDEAVALNAQVIAVSAMMLHTARGENGATMVRRLLQERCLEQQIALVVGGAPYRFDANLYRVVGADAWSADGVTAGHVIRDLIRERA